MPRPVHPLVISVARGMKPPGVPQGSIQAHPPVPAADIRDATPGALAYASDVPEAILFVGFFGGLVQRPGGGEWQILYLDLELTRWLLVESSGIAAVGHVKDDAVPFNQRRDVIWVKADATVGRGSACQSVEAQFLTGEFTRAGDFEAPPSGGTLAAATGVFCEARTPSCCRIRTRP
jgi:hypothetical protein